MANKASKYTVDMKIEYIPMPSGHEEKWRNGIRLLLQILMDDSLAGTPNAQSLQQVDEGMSVDHICDDSGVQVPMLSMEDVAESKKVVDKASKYAWFVGQDGSAHCAAIGNDARL